MPAKKGDYYVSVMATDYLNSENIPFSFSLETSESLKSLQKNHFYNILVENKAFFSYIKHDKDSAIWMKFTTGTVGVIL
jgi:hypothetical protein